MTTVASVTLVFKVIIMTIINPNGDLSNMYDNDNKQSFNCCFYGRAEMC